MAVDTGGERGLSAMRPAQAEAPPRTTTIEIDHDLVVLLRKEAAQRDMPVGRLIRDLLDIIATDQLTTAILDD
jgi:hypothetical protein